MKKSRKYHLVLRRRNIIAILLTLTTLAAAENNAFAFTYTGKAPELCHPENPDPNDPRDQPGHPSDWNNPKNWGTPCAPKGPPPNGASVTIGSQFHVNAPASITQLGGLTLAGTLNMAGPVDISSLTINGGTLNLPGLRSTDPAAKLIVGSAHLNGGTIHAYLIVSGSSMMTWSGGMIWGDVFVGGGGTLIINGSENFINDSTVEMNGNIDWNAGKIIQVGGDDTHVNINNRGTFNANGSGAIQTGGYLWFSLNNYKTFTKGGVGVTTFDQNGGARPMFFRNYGTMNMKAGRFNVPSGNLLLLDKSVLKGPGIVEISGGVLNIPHPEPAEEPPITVTITGHIVLSGGHFEGDGKIIGDGGIFDWSGGGIGSGQGPYTAVRPATLNVPPGMTMNIGGPNDKRLGGNPGTCSVCPSQHGVINNEGTINWTDSGDIYGDSSGGHIINNGLFNILNDDAMFRANASITNKAGGIVRKKNSNGTTTIGEGASLYNHGLLDTQTGVVNFTSSLVLEDGSAVSGAGLARVSHHVFMRPAGVVELTGRLELAAGYAEGDAQFVGNGTFIWTGGSIGEIHGFDYFVPAIVNIGPSITMNIVGDADKRLGSGDSFCQSCIRQHGTIKNAGTVNWSGKGNIFAADGGGEIINSGVFNVLNNGKFFNHSHGGHFTNEATGIFRKTSTATTSIEPGIGFTNKGLLDIRFGILTLAQSLASAATASYTGDGLIVLHSGLSATGNFVVAKGLTMEMTGGSLGFTNNEDGTPTGKLVTQGNGKFIWGGGGIGGQFTIAPGSTFLIEGDAGKAIYTHSRFTNEGTIKWSGAGAISLHGGNSDGPHFVNRGTFDVLTSAPLSAGAYSRAFFANHGIVNIGGGSNPGYGKFNTETLGVFFEPDGVVNMDIGGAVAGKTFDQMNRGGDYAPFHLSYGRLGGTLNVSFTGGFSPTAGSSFNLVTGMDGQFDTIIIDSNRQFRADYADRNLTLVVASVIKIISPLTDTKVLEGKDVTVKAQVGDGVTEVAFYDNGRLVQTLTEGPFTAQLTGLAPGLHLISAVATTPGETDTRSEIQIIVNPVGGKTYTYSGPANGEWNNANNWTPAGVPGENDSAILRGEKVKTSGAVEVRALALDDATLNGPGEVTVTEHLAFLSGAIRNLPLTIPIGGSCLLVSDGPKNFDGVKIDNAGSFNISGKTNITGDANTAFTNRGLFSFTLESLFHSFSTVKFALFRNDGGRVLLRGGLLDAEEYIQDAGETDFGIRSAILTELLFHSIDNMLINGGSLTGSGGIDGDLDLTGGFFMPGSSPGSVQITGSYRQRANATLVLETAGTEADKYDQLQIGGKATLGGKLIVRAIQGFAPQPSDTFSPITYASVTGKFAEVSSNADITIAANGATMQVEGPNPPAPKALNISTRMRVGTGDNALIAGFIVTGEQPKKVLIRGLGPSLPVNGALADPTLDLDGGAVLNDDWRKGQEAAVRATGIPPSKEVEAAIVATLNPGPHTAALRGKGGSTGVGLVEVYDLESGKPEQLANISTRGEVLTGDDVMIGGFIIDGIYPAKVLLRAIGPSLPVQGALQDPTLDLVDAQGNILRNDNWRATQEAEIAAVLPPNAEKEAAIIATLVPGAYTAIVRGKDGATGVALVEGYNLQ